MGQIGRVLFSEECEKEIKERWPDRCPECGCVAYIGLSQVSCVSTLCRHGSDKESNDYHELVDADEVKFPGNQMLEYPNIGELRSYASKFDWHDHIEYSAPISDNGKGEWTYQLPVGECRKLYIGDQHVSTVNGITYAVCKMDRVKDTITICWDNRVIQP